MDGSSVDRAELNGRVCRSLQEVSVLLDEGDRRVLRGLGLSPTQFALLRRLDEASVAAGYGHTISRLAELTLCTRGNVTRLVQRLVEAGLVETNPDAADRRLVRVVITPAGTDLLAAARHRHTELNRARLADTSDRDLAQLYTLLTSVSRQLRAHLG